MKKGRVFFRDIPAGTITETEEGYSFVYDEEYISGGYPAVSVTLPVSQQEYVSPVLFSFFDGLIPEGWFLDIAVENWKIDIRDRMELLLTCCHDVIGAVSVRRLADE